MTVWNDDMKRAAIKDAAMVCKQAERIADLESALREARGMLRSCGWDEPEAYIDPELKASWERGLAKIDAALTQ